MKTLLSLTFCILLCGCGKDSIWQQAKYGGGDKAGLTMATVTPIPKLLRVRPTPTPTPTASPTPKPLVQTLPATTITSVSAKLNWRVNPNGSATTTHASYGLTPAYGTDTTTVGAGSGHKVVNKSATVTGLTPGAIYHYRGVATNPGGTTSGADTVFTMATATPTPTITPTPTPTATPVPVVVTGVATNLGPTTATLNGTVDPKGAATTYLFSYGLTTGYGSSTSTTSAGNGQGAVDEAAAVTGLSTSTTYHFRIQATNGGGTANGADATFTTSTPTPTPTATPTPAREPHGLYVIGGTSYLTDPNFNGVRSEVRWNDGVNPSDGVYDFTRIDNLMNPALNGGKQIGLSVRILSDVPAWVQALGGITMYSYDGGNGAVPFVLPWDTVARPKIIAFITALCQHYDGKMYYIVMGGMGFRTETYMPTPEQLGIGMSDADYMALYVTSSNGLIDVYQSNLASTVFIMAGGIPNAAATAVSSITSIFNHGLTYSHFGTMQWGLSASSSNRFLINKWIQDNPAHAGGFQMNGASDGSVGGNVCGSLVPPQCTPDNSLSLALDNAVNLSGQFVEVYGADALNSNYVDLFALINSELLSAP